MGTKFYSIPNSIVQFSSEVKDGILGTPLNWGASCNKEGLNNCERRYVNYCPFVRAFGNLSVSCLLLSALHLFSSS